MGSWIEYFKFSWPLADAATPTSITANPWEVSFDLSEEMEVGKTGLFRRTLLSFFANRMDMPG